MKYCRKCGKEHPDDAIFCGKCGTQFLSESCAVSNAKQPKGKKKILIILGVVFIFVAVITAIFIAIKEKQKVKEYENYITMAEKYVEDLDYEQAEESYLEAIEIKSKQREPYIELAKVYIKQEEYDKAIDILEQADQAGAIETEETKELETEIEKQIEELKNMIEFSWVVEPTIEAEDIYYLEDAGEDFYAAEEICKKREDSYYYKAMLWAVENGITTGMTDTTFAPNGNCTRGQVVTFLWRANNEPQPQSTEHPFTDGKEGSYYYKAMLWAVENKVTSGMTDTTFAPNGNCTRGQVVTFLYRVQK